eukprot:8954891-Pyramimonas_sp.AAC.1
MQTSDAIPPPCLRHVQMRRQPRADHYRMVDELRRSWEIGLTELRVVLPTTRWQGRPLPRLQVLQMHVVLLPLLQ